MRQGEDVLGNLVSPDVDDINCLLLLWWPHILKSKSINSFDFIVNLHPSLLPYGRGKYGYFWSIINSEPFGASLHLVDEGIDTGQILVQKEVFVAPTDTGEDLYQKGVDACISLFDEQICNLLENLVERVGSLKQCSLTEGSSHSKADFVEYCNLAENQKFYIQDVIRYLQARTFQNGTSYRFEIGDKTYECKLSVSEIE